jgi:hypothetical protein
VNAGVEFPSSDGTRSTSAFGRAVVSAALEPVDPVGARSARAATNWRTDYVAHFRRLIEAGIDNPEGARASAAAGLSAALEHLRWSAHTDNPDQADNPDPGVSLTDVIAGRVAASGALDTDVVRGQERPLTELAIPFRGGLLTGADRDRQLDAWVAAGAMEPSAAESIRVVAAHPEWLSLPGRTIVCLGAGAEIGAAPTLLRWGATVAGIDLRRSALWTRLAGVADDSAGTLIVPATGAGDLASRAGADLLTQLPELIDWTVGLPGDLVLGNFLYADGGTNVRISGAADALGQAVRQRGREVTLGFLATPTDAFVVPPEAVAAATAAYDGRSAAARMAGRGLRAVSRGRLLQRNYPPTAGSAEPGINDALVPQQGPNYALGKRMQRWRATTEHDAGRPVSMNIAPPTRTRSVVKNRALAAAYAGAHRFGVEVFEPATTRVLMAALLVHDLHQPPPRQAEPWQEETYQAIHGGLWRAAFSPRSALGLAAVLGYGGSRG